MRFDQDAKPGQVEGFAQDLPAKEKRMDYTNDFCYGHEMHERQGTTVFEGREPSLQCYSIRRIRFDDLTPQELNDWRFARSNYSTPDPSSDPDWLRGYFAGQTENLSVYMLYRYGVPCGATTFTTRNWPLDCYLGDFRVLRLPMLRLRLVGIDFPEDELAYDMLWVELESDDCDAVFLDAVPVESFVWQYARRADDSFRIYLPGDPSPRPRIRISGTFEAYLKQFSARHRHNLRRRVSKFQEECSPMRVERYTAPEQVAPFLELALLVSRKTYQWKVFNRGLTDTGVLTRRLEFAAANGWFRSYILFSGDKPVAFVAGWQRQGIYDHHEIGYDPDYRKYAPGTVLHMAMIEDLFSADPPGILDFGSYAKYKEELSTESYPEGRMFLFKRRPYTRLAESFHRASLGVTAWAGSMLDQWQLKSRVRAWVRK